MIYEQYLIVREPLGKVTHRILLRELSDAQARTRLEQERDQMQNRLNNVKTRIQTAVDGQLVIDDTQVEWLKKQTDIYRERRDTLQQILDAIATLP